MFANILLNRTRSLYVGYLAAYFPLRSVQLGETSTHTIL